jgi:hypothetical protein
MEGWAQHALMLDIYLPIQCDQTLVWASDGYVHGHWDQREDLEREMVGFQVEENQEGRIS